MIVTDDGYSISYNQRANKIIISLPQTMQTASNTTAVIFNRKSEFTDSELTAILAVTKVMAERGGEMNNGSREDEWCRNLRADMIGGISNVYD